MKRVALALFAIIAICPIAFAQEIPALGFSLAIDTHGRVKPVQTTTFASMRNVFNRDFTIDLVTVIAIEKNVPLGFGATYSRRIADNAFWTIGVYGAATAGSIQGGVLTGLTILLRT